MATARQPRRPARSARGGHTALTPALQRRIVANVKKGTHIEIAARAAGVSKATFYRWMDDGRDRPDPEDPTKTIVASQPYRDFRDAIEKAEADLEQSVVDRYLTVSKQAAFGNASHMAGFLGRRFRGRWDPKQTVEISGPEGGPVKIEGTADDRLAGALAALARTGKIAFADGQGESGDRDPDAGAADGDVGEPDAEGPG